MEYTLEIVREKLGTDINWMRRALVVITEKNQTSDEQAPGDTRWANGIGWNGVDAKILTSFAGQVKKGWKLSDKQVAVAQKKLPKYAKQVLALINENNIPPEPRVVEEEKDIEEITFKMKETIMDISKLINVRL
jgi:hypothetical protein